MELNYDSDTHPLVTTVTSPCSSISCVTVLFMPPASARILADHLSFKFSHM